MFAADYLTDPDVDSIPTEAEGLLLRMWCICHIEGSCPADPAELARKTRCSLHYVLQCKPHCDSLFRLDRGRLFSPRMEAEKARSLQASENARRRWHKADQGFSSDSKQTPLTFATTDGSAIGNANRNANGIADRSAVRTPQSQSQSQMLEAGTVGKGGELHTAVPETAKNTPLATHPDEGQNAGSKAPQNRPAGAPGSSRTTNQVPTDLSPYHLARRLLTKLGLPEKSNVEVVAEGIKALAGMRGKSYGQAFDEIQSAAIADQAAGTAIDHFWFVDGRYRTEGKKSPTRSKDSYAATTDFSDRVDRERGYLDRLQDKLAN